MTLYYPPTQNGLQKTLDAQLNQGVTSQMTLNNTTGIPNKRGVVVVDRIDTAGREKPTIYREYIAYSGVSGNNLIGLTRGLAGSTDQDHLVGAVVEFIFDVTTYQALLDTYTTEHNEDGTHSNITATSVNSPSVKTDTIEEKTSGAGVSFSNKITLPNNIPIQAKDSGGTAREVLKIDSNNYLHFGNENLAGLSLLTGQDGWIYANETWTYASSTSFTISGDKTAKYTAGTLLKLTQSSTVKYFRVLASSHSSGTTTVVVNSVSGHSIANSTITDNFYMRPYPQGLPSSFGLSNGGYVITDNLSSDYFLQRGERAIRTFSNTTSVPLNIATESGTVYSMVVSPSNSYSNTGGAVDHVYIYPNNTTYSNQFHNTEFGRGSGGLSSSYQMIYSAFRFSASICFVSLTIQNFTTAKLMVEQELRYGISNDFPSVVVSVTAWDNTTTPWTSLGTVVFPQNTSGVIYIERLV